MFQTPDRDQGDGSKQTLLSSEEIEHVAARARELGDGMLEQACDFALAYRESTLGTMTFEGIVREIVEKEEAYAIWLKHGRSQGFQRRSVEPTRGLIFGDRRLEKDPR